VGSLVPDAGYLFARRHLDVFSHSLAGSFVFCLPAGILLFLAIFGLRVPVVNLLPDRHRQLFLPLCRRPIGHPVIIAISILIGTWTHQFWDSCTHAQGWLTELFPVLRTQVAIVRGHRVELYHLLLHGSSFIGVTWICLAYGKWRKAADPRAKPVARQVSWRNAFLAATATLLIASLHQLNIFGLALVGSLSCLLALVVALKFDDCQPPSQIGNP